MFFFLKYHRFKFERKTVLIWITNVLKTMFEVFLTFFSAEKCLLSYRLHGGDLILLAQESGQVGAPDG
jgi:hypothetical protein